MGALAVVPALEGLSASAHSTGAVTVVGGSSGRRVTLYGLPLNEPFDIIPRVSPMDPPKNVSGLEAEVLDPHTIRVIGFASTSAEARKLGLEVTGRLVRSGPRLQTQREYPIVIRAEMGPLREALRNLLKLKGKVTRISDEADFEEVADQVSEGEKIELYSVHFRGDAVSIL